MTKKTTNVVLCILDGWGINHSTDNNGIAAAATPCWTSMSNLYPHSELQASELYVGLPDGQMGNSEVGHMTIGSGRVIMQDLPRIDMAIEHQKIPLLAAFKSFSSQALKATKVVHLMGLLSPGGVHSHQDHLIYCAKILAAQGLEVKIHAFLDGRDTPPKSAHDYLSSFLTALLDYPTITLASFCGRYFAMDRDQRWDRIQSAYEAMVEGVGKQSIDPLQTIADSYENDIGDEFVLPHVCQGYKGMNDGDCLMMVNFRADRVRQLLTALLDPEFKEFTPYKRISFAATLGMAPYSQKLTALIPALFDKHPVTHTLGQTVSEAGLKQLRVAETEKYAHVTFFFNGGRELLFAGEERKLIASPQVATYDLQPEMSAPEMTDYLVEIIEQQTHDLIVVNYANADMVGHTGMLPAIVQAIETVDQCLGRLIDICKKTQTILVITADHGNAEQIVDSVTGEPHTAHTLNPVPFLVANAPSSLILKNGSLENIAPTVLDLMNLDKPKEMTGVSLIEWKDACAG
jgi:2,3-bisphosphoglycerate-independent phosphoglycerate mutase